MPKFDLSSDDKILWDSLMSVFIRPMLTVGDEIGFFSAIDQGATNLQDIASKLNISFKAAEILASVLASMHYVVKKGHQVALTPTAKNYLLPQSAFYWGALFRNFQDKTLHQRILQALKSTSPQLTHQAQSFTQMWEEGTITKEAAVSFTSDMQTEHSAAAAYLAQSGVFNNVNHLLDVGAGSGCFGLAFINNYPDKHVTLFDLPNVCELIKHEGKGNTVTIYAGNFLKEPWPKKHDAILLSQILHDWPREIDEQILARAYTALEPGGKIVIHEMLLDENKDSPQTVVFCDLLMFINHRSQQSTRNELFGLLSKAGFKNPTAQPMFGYFSAITAVK